MNVHTQDGFTLIEVIIAMFLLAVGILAAATMQISSMSGNLNATRLTEASLWGGDTVETLLARPYTATEIHDDLLDDSGNGAAGLNDTDTAGALADGGPVQEGTFTVFWNIADDFPVNNCKSIRVIIRRNDSGTTKDVIADYIKMGPI